MPKTIKKPTGTDWARVKRETAADAPIPAGVVAQLMGHKPSATAEKALRRQAAGLAASAPGKD